MEWKEIEGSFVDAFEQMQKQSALIARIHALAYEYQCKTLKPEDFAMRVHQVISAYCKPATPPHERG